METVNKYGRLTILEIHGKVARCQCDCGTVKNIEKYHVFNGNTKSCGCLRKEAKIKFGQHRRTHGLSNSRTKGYGSRTYGIWQAMRDRCNNPNRADYKYYGGKGISYAPEWNDFTKFLSDMGEAPESLTLDRIDITKGYTKTNCRWATRKQQSRNTRRSLYVKVNGELVSVRDYIDSVGIPLHRFRQRYYVYGWTLEQACELQPK